MTDVRLDGRLADPQLDGDLTVGHRPGHQPQYIELAIGERAEDRARLLWLDDGLCEAVKQPTGDRRRDHRIAGSNGPNRRDQILRWCVFEQKSTGSSAKRRYDVLVEIERRQHED